MKFSEFQRFVEQHSRLFQGVHPETPESVLAAEESLGYALPESLKWLLFQWGYSDGCAIDSLEEAVQATLRCRQNSGLPRQFLVLNDWQDTGVVWMDRGATDPHGESPIYWSGAHNFLRLVTGEPLDEDVDVFPDYPAWVQFRVGQIQEENS